MNHKLYNELAHQGALMSSDEEEARMAICRYGVVSGTVQGVGFRAYVEEVATRAGLTGYARNLPDGQVEVLLCGDKAAVAAAEAEVAKGPPASRVQAVAWEERAYEDLRGFTTG